MSTIAVVNTTIATDNIRPTRPDLMRLCRSATERSLMPIAATEGLSHIVRYANPAFCRLVGSETFAVLGHPCADIISEKRKDECLELLDRVYSTGETGTIAEREHVTNEGASVYWSFMAWPVFDDDERLAGVMLQVTDSTEAMVVRRRNERVEDEIREVNQQLLISCIREQHRAEVAAETDPRTELSWSESLRTWAIDHLKRGSEITILFIDLDRFGEFNKVYGHVVGDEVLQCVAHALVTTTDRDLDFVCRYGGDEFCVGTLRSANEAAALAERITHQISQISIPALGSTRIGCSIGQAGGQRTKDREVVHYPSMINNLINVASQASTARKPR